MARLLQINAVYGRGSTGIIVKDISQMVIDNGWESYVASAEIKGEETNGTHLITVGSRLDHKLHAILSRLLGLQGYFSILVTRKLLKKIDRIKPDIIHIHNLHSNYINVNLLFKYIKANRITTVITLHDCWFFTGKCYHYLYDNCEKWKTHCKKCPRLRAEIPSLIFDFSSHVFEDRKKWIGENEYVHIVGVSKWITNEAIQSILSKRVYGTIYNGVDLQVFHPIENSKRKELGIDDKFVILGMANKWLAQENEETFKQYLKKKKENWVLLLLGSQDMHTTFKGVIGLPYVQDRKEMASLYSMADVFVNITKVDSLPTVNIEALACGTPIVTYESGGSAEIVSKDVGISVPYGNTEALIASIEEIENIGKAFYLDKCVQRAKTNYDIRSCYKEYLELYQSLC